MIEASFGNSPPFSVGLEEEVMIVDAGTLAQSPAVDVFVRESEQLDLPGVLKPELFASVVELTSGVCKTAQEARDALAALRRAAAEIAERHDLAIMAAGTHPLSVPEEQEIAAEERYRRFVEYAGITARRQGVNGLHVHVGMPSAETCFAVLERVLAWLPVVLAQSANSPYLAGRETGMLSVRAEILGTLPRAGAPPAFGSYAAWERFVLRLGESGLPFADDYTSFWWDARPHPRFGTLEIRMPDQPTGLDRTAGLAALLQALCKTAAEAGNAPTPAERGDYQQNRWAAARFGPRALLLHPTNGTVTPAAELASELLDSVTGAARELRCEGLLAALDPHSCEADEQLEIGRGHGLAALSRELVERTLRST